MVPACRGVTSRRQKSERVTVSGTQAVHCLLGWSPHPRNPQHRTSRPPTRIHLASHSNFLTSLEVSNSTDSLLSHGSCGPGALDRQEGFAPPLAEGLSRGRHQEAGWGRGTI